MTVLVLDEAVGEELIRQRKERGIDRKDEVWDGVYVIMPDPSIPHQRLVKRLTAILDEIVGGGGRGEPAAIRAAPPGAHRRDHGGDHRPAGR